MNYGYLFAFVLITTELNCSSEKASEGWFQGEWISDRIATDAAQSNRLTSPSTGYLYWSVQENTIYSSDHSIDLEENILFATEAVTDEGFNLITENDKYLIRRTESGFCAELYGVQSSQITIECFVNAH